MILELMSEAQASGARLAPACRVVGISARSIERWRADPEAGDRRCGPQRRPSNALSPAEEAQIVTVLTSSRYAGLSPKQLRCTELAGEGIVSILDRAPGNDAPIGGVKVIAKSGWFVARPSGTEEIYKIYAESFRGEEHLDRIVNEAQAVVDAALASE